MIAPKLQKFVRVGKRFAADRRGMTSIETALMFGVFAVSFALIASNIFDSSEQKTARNSGSFEQEIDNIVTGSIGNSGRYTIRQSVLQPTKNSRCIILSDGRRLGEC